MNPFDYTHIRKKQFYLAKLQEYMDDELMSFYNHDCCKNFAKILTEKFFPEANRKALGIEIRELYKIYLTLAPIIQKVKYSWKIDYSEAVYISFLRRNINKRTGRYHIKITEIERPLDVKSLKEGFCKAKINAPEFIEKVKESYLFHYRVPHLRGSLANRIFDPFIFYEAGEGFRLRKSNQIIRLEKDKFKDSTDVRHSGVTIGKYNIQLRGTKTGESSYLHTTIAENETEKFKKKIETALQQKNDPGKKLEKCKGIVFDFTENIKYAISDIEGIFLLKKWLHQNNALRRLAMNCNEYMELPELLQKQYEEKSPRTKMFFTKPNFFWTPDEIKKEQYLNFFSPYAEM